MGASLLVVLAMTAAVHVYTSRAPGPARRAGGFGAWPNATAKPLAVNTTKAPPGTPNAIVAGASAQSPALAVPLVPLQPRGAPFWVSNASAHAGGWNKTATVG